MGLFAPIANAHEDSMVVILTLEESDYESGDRAGANVHVFDNGQRIDPDNSPVLSFLVMDMDYDYQVRDVETSISSSGSGQYYGEVEIFDSDVEQSIAGGFRINDIGSTARGNEYVLSYGKSTDDDEIYDYVDSWDVDAVYFAFPPSEEGLSIDYSIKNIDQYPWMPGDTVEIDFEVRYDGRMVKPDSFLLISDSYDFDYDLDVPYNKPSDGKYESFFTIPASLKRSDEFTITARASKGDEVAVIDLEIPVSHFCLWYKPDDFNETVMDIGLWVSDSEGKAVHGIEVGFWSYEWDDIIFVNDTNEIGKASFRIPKWDSDVYIDGWITNGEYNQSFTGDIVFPAEVDDETAQNPDTWGFDVISDDDEYDMIGERSKKQLTAFMDGSPHSNVKIQYYAYTYHDILGYGSVNTDIDGNFEIDFDNDLESSSVMVDFLTPNGYHPGVFRGYGWVDTDGDGFSDKFENDRGTDMDDSDDFPVSYCDTDYDGFGDRYEDHVGTDPEDPLDFPYDWKDTDDDGFGDEFEIEVGTESENGYSYPVSYQDSDGDSFGDRYEISEGSDPYDSSVYPSDFSDADGDGYGDDYEEYKSTDPYNQFDYPIETADEDSDGHSDDEENYYGTDPSDPSDYPGNSYEKNSDEDSTNLGGSYYDYHYDGEEEFYGTDPDDPSDYPYDIYSVDTDGDGVSDEEEIFHGTDPEDSEDYPFNTYLMNTDGDYIHISWSYIDYQYDKEEEFYGTDPDDDMDYPYDIYQDHSDYDGICDEEERFYGTNPESGSDSPLFEPSPHDTRFSDHNSTDGMRYERESMVLYPPGSALDRFCDQDVFIQIENFKVGGMNSVRISCDHDLQWPNGGIYLGDLGESFGSISTAQWGQWECFTGDDSFVLYRSNGEYMGMFTIPEFLPGGNQEYTIIGGEMGAYSQVSVNYLVLNEGQSKSAGFYDEEDDDSVLPVILITGSAVAAVIIILVILVVLIVVIRKKKKGRQAGDRSVTVQQPAPQQTPNASGQPSPAVKPGGEGIGNIPPQPPSVSSPTDQVPVQTRSEYAPHPGNQQIIPAQKPPGQFVTQAASTLDQRYTSSQTGQLNAEDAVMDLEKIYPPPPPVIQKPVPPKAQTQSLPPAALPQNQPVTQNRDESESKYGLDDLFK
ncbi:MAG: hypothetical protein ACMUIG_03855 [Thermoplasmatota archaeon]